MDLSVPSELLKPHIFDKRRDCYLFATFVERILHGIDSKDPFMNDAVSWIGDAKLNLKTIEDFMSIPSVCGNLFLHVMVFLGTIPLHDYAKKRDFFQNLMGNLTILGSDLVSYRVLPKLLNLDVLLEPAASLFLLHLFSPKEQRGILSAEDFDSIMVPHIEESFESHFHKGMRIVLLCNIRYYIWSLSPYTVQSLILEQVKKTCSETDSTLVEKSFDALLVIAIYFLKCDENVEGKIGLTCINGQILPILHQHVVGKGSVTGKTQALLCLVKLWSRPVDHGIILSAIESGLWSSSPDVKLSCLNVLLLNLSCFTPFEQMKYLYPRVLSLRLDENDQIRDKTVKILKSILENGSKIEKIQVEQIEPLFPSSSHTEIVITNNFHGVGPKIQLDFEEELKDFHFEQEKPM